MKTSCPSCGHGTDAPGGKATCARCLAEFLVATTEAGPDPLPLKPGGAFRGFAVLDVIGRGGMGVVYKARQVELDRLVALKVMAPRFAADAQFVGRFNREARALAALNHPHIVHIHEFGRDGDLLYLAMEFVDGLSLREIMRRGRLKPAEALRIVPQICDALEYAHEQGVVHRDIKPENILVDKRGTVKIADFGLARLARPDEPGLTRTDVVMGTPNYIAPEQRESMRVDHRADIYSLGVVFYEMLTGELPFGKFDPPSRRVEVDVRLDEIVLKALAKEPERRYQRAAEVKTDVETVLASPGAPPRRGAGPSTSLLQTTYLVVVLLAVAGAVLLMSGRASGPLAAALLNAIGILALVSLLAVFAIKEKTRPEGPRVRPAIMALGLGTLLIVGLLMVAGGVMRAREAEQAGRARRESSLETGQHRYAAWLRTRERARLDEAIAALRAAEPTPENLHLLGQALRDAGDFGEARRALEECIATDPVRVDARVDLGLTLLRLNRPMAAIQAFDGALAARPDDARALALKGRALVARNDFARARSCLSEALRLKPDDEAARKLLESVEMELRIAGIPGTRRREGATYDIVTTADDDTTAWIARHVERIHARYTQALAPAQPVESKARVLVLSHRGDAPAGWQGTAPGYYDSAVNRLVLFVTDDRDAMLAVLYHESLHQFLANFVESPPWWFAEGLGEYFAGHVWNERTGAFEPRPNAARLAVAKELLEDGRPTSLRRIIEMTGEEAIAAPVVSYAESWALAHYLMEHDGGRRRALVREYFAILAREQNAHAAGEATFGREDLTALEAERRRFIQSLR